LMANLNDFRRYNIYAHFKFLLSSVSRLEEKNKNNNEDLSIEHQFYFT
jgi:hypothetical protein